LLRGDHFSGLQTYPDGGNSIETVHEYILIKFFILKIETIFPNVETNPFFLFHIKIK
jgi:hypothetical protein